MRGAAKPIFFANPQHRSNFFRFAKVTDFYIVGHFYGDGAPYLYTMEDARRPDFKIKVVADISCDINDPLASTIRPSTIGDSVYGYDPETGKETNFLCPGAIAVMAVDNLPCELPRDASSGFGEAFSKYVVPTFFNNDPKGYWNVSK